MTYKIIKNAPPIPKRETRGSKAKYPFNDMEVGDAFDVPADPKDEAGDNRHPVQSKVSASASSKNATNRRAGRPGLFRVRYLRDEGVVRVWRVK